MSDDAIHAFIVPPRPKTGPPVLRAARPESPSQEAQNFAVSEKEEERKRHYQSYHDHYYSIVPRDPRLPVPLKPIIPDEGSASKEQPKHEEKERDELLAFVGPPNRQFTPPPEKAEGHGKSTAPGIQKPGAPPTSPGGSRITPTERPSTRSPGHTHQPYATTPQSQDFLPSNLLTNSPATGSFALPGEGSFELGSGDRFSGFSNPPQHFTQEQHYTQHQQTFTASAAPGSPSQQSGQTYYQPSYTLSSFSATTSHTPQQMMYQQSGYSLPPQQQPPQVMMMMQEGPMYQQSQPPMMVQQSNQGSGRGGWRGGGGGGPGGSRGRGRGGDRDRYGSQSHGHAPPPGMNHNNAQKSPLLQSFHDNSRAQNWSLSDVTGHITEFSMDQDGSRLIQRLMVDDESAGIVYEEVKGKAAELMVDVFGNYVIQRLLETGLASHRTGLVFAMKGQVLSLSLQTYGCRVVQKALHFANPDEQRSIASELVGHVADCVRDQNGNHVVQKCIEMMPNEVQFISEAFRGHLPSLASHAYGCRVMQRLFERCPNTDRSLEAVVYETLQYTEQLIDDQYGNYVMQHILINGTPAWRRHVMGQIQSRFAKLSCSKYSSNVTEKLFVHVDENDRAQIIESILNDRDQQGMCAFVYMMQDQFANYVVQKILDLSSNHQRDRIVDAVRPWIHEVRRYTFGKHIVARLEKMGLLAPGSSAMGGGGGGGGGGRGGHHHNHGQQHHGHQQGFTQHQQMHHGSHGSHGHRGGQQHGGGYQNQAQIQPPMPMGAYTQISMAPAPADFQRPQQYSHEPQGYGGSSHFGNALPFVDPAVASAFPAQNPRGSGGGGYGQRRF